MAVQEAWKQLYEYWLSKHVGGRPPARHELDPPVDVPRLIPNIMLIDLEGAFPLSPGRSALWNAMASTDRHHDRRATRRRRNGATR